MQRLAILIALSLTSSASAAGPTCALLDPEKTPRGALLEAKLLAEPNATWVERASIDAVLKEQKLQAAFLPQGVGERVKLGKLLKADVLVMVRPAKDAVEVVVSESAGGLRLLHRVIPVTKDADADVAALVAGAREGIRKHGETVKEVVAVPPFVSNDLGYQFEHLKGAFAKLAESVALDRKGVVVVELAEAEALAKELALAAPGAKVERPSPLYLVGEYRHEGRDKERTATLKLRTERGGKLVGKPETFTVKADAAVETLRKWAASVLDATGGAVALPDPKAEAMRLGELAAAHQRLGNWPEAMALIEASLLLDVKQPELNADAMAILRYWLEETLRQYSTDADYLAKAAALHRRGFVHMESLLTHGELLPRHRGFGSLPLRVFESSFPFPHRPDPTSNYTVQVSPEHRAIIDELEKERREMFRRMLPLAAKTGTAREMEALVKGAVGILPATEHYAEYAKLILKYQDSKGMVEALNMLIFTYPVIWTAEGYQIYRKFLDVLDKDGNAGVREAVGRFRQTLPGNEKVILAMVAKRIAEDAERKRLAEEARKNPRPPSTIRFNATRAELDSEIDEKQKTGPLRRVELKAAQADDDWFVDQLRGVVAAGPGVDVFWAPAKFPHAKPGDNPNRPIVGGTWIRSGLGILVMKEKGVLKRVFAKPNTPEKVTDACFDGKYVWIAAEGELRRSAPALFVIDPVAETVHEVTVEEGLPEMPKEVTNDLRRHERMTLHVAPLDKGRVCVTGWFGRAWIGVATFDGDKNKVAVKVIHEAKEVPRQGEKDPWMNPKLSFVPDYARTVRGKPDADGKATVRVLVGRGWPMLSSSRVNDYLPQMGPYPLLVDPDAGTVETVKDRIRIAGWQIAAYSDTADGSIYVAYPPGGGGFTCNLYRIDSPGKVHDLGQLAVERGGSNIPVRIVGDRLYLAILNTWEKRTLQPGGIESMGSSWWTADANGKNIRKIADDTLRVRHIHHSSHYGLIAWCDLGDGLTRWVCNELVEKKK